VYHSDAQRRIGEIIAGKRAITIDTGLRLARFFGMNDGFWIGLQTDYDTAMAKNTLADVLTRIHRFQPESGNPPLTSTASRQQP